VRLVGDSVVLNASSASSAGRCKTNSVHHEEEVMRVRVGQQQAEVENEQPFEHFGLRPLCQDLHGIVASGIIDSTLGLGLQVADRLGTSDHLDGGWPDSGGMTRRHVRTQPIDS
jgi:hypothetical protein